MKYLFYSFIALLGFNLQAQQKPYVVFVAGDHEYSGEVTMPIFAQALEKDYGFTTKVLSAFPNQNSEKNIPNLAELAKADMVVFFLRWRQLPDSQLVHIENYLKSGKPVLGFRTSTHAFNFPKGHPQEQWNDFGEFALNAPPGWRRKGDHHHYGHNSTTQVYAAKNAINNQLLKGVNPNFNVPSWLYHVLPSYPTKGSTWLLMGKAINPDHEAIDNPVAWYGINSFGAKVFTTTLGHPEDLQQKDLQKLIINAIHWGVGKKIPKKLKEKLPINIPYRGIVNN